MLTVIILNTTKWKWCAVWCPKTGKFVAQRKDKNNRSVYMHRLILGVPAGLQVDHRNMDPLDNKRANIRICSGSENMCNRRKQCNNVSGFKGVSWYRWNGKKGGKWKAQIRYRQRWYFTGYFDYPIAAAKAYDCVATKLHGRFARTLSRLPHSNLAYTSQSVPLVQS